MTMTMKIYKNKKPNTTMPVLISFNTKPWFSPFEDSATCKTSFFVWSIKDDALDLITDDKQRVTTEMMENSTTDITRKIELVTKKLERKNTWNSPLISSLSIS